MVWWAGSSRHDAAGQLLLLLTLLILLLGAGVTHGRLEERVHTRCTWSLADALACWARLSEEEGSAVQHAIRHGTCTRAKASFINSTTIV